MGHALPFMSNQYYILQMSHWANGRAAAALALQTALAEGKIPEPPCRPPHRKPRPTSVFLLESLCHIQPHLLFTTIQKDHMIHKKKKRDCTGKNSSTYTLGFSYLCHAAGSFSYLNMKNPRQKTL